MDRTILEAQVNATVALIGLPIAAEHHEGVLRYFGIAAGLAALVMAQPLEVEDEATAVFTPVEPAERQP